jgi:membrane-associated protein
MPRRLFMLYNIVGALCWAVGVTLAGYFLGALIPGVDRYIVPIVAFILVTSVLPGVVPVIRDPARRSAVAARIRTLFTR